MKAGLRLALSAAVLTGLVAAAAPPARAAAPTAPTVPATDHEVSFVVDGTTTYGTLHVPAHHRGRTMKAALLLPGSGPTDRNGDQAALAPHTLTQLAAALSREGVVSLRFDKYGTGRTGLGAYARKPETIDYDAFVRQADAAYRLLAGRPEIDRRAVHLIGHSEGALTALRVAVTARPRADGVGLLQPLARRFLDVLAQQLRDQLAAAVDAGQLDRPRQRAAERAVDRAVADLRAHRPIGTEGMPPAVAELFRGLAGPSRRYVETIDAVEPASLARRLPPGTRTLLTCGTADPQVPCDATTELAAVVGRVVLPGVGHLMTDPAAPGTLAPSLLDAVHRFLRD
ncbi:alpha/beta hydrolase family protein [Cryptosporangium japonicum]|uniref:Alpha/beta fold hydrolase n=1 Tax=Cryptosporangium japonicum TaxID=80872 RepID=A0ABP3DCH9_9ACTN